MKNFLNFEYDGERLSDYQMMVCRFDGSGGIETVSSGADLTFQQIRPSGSCRFRLYSSSYDTALSATFQICRHPDCPGGQEEAALSAQDISALQRWLCRRDYKRFKILLDGFEHLYWNGTFGSKQIEYNGQIIGLELTLYTDAPFSFMDEVSAVYDCSAGTSFDLFDNSDEITAIDVQILPDMEITILGDGDFTLMNSMDTRIMRINNCRMNEVLRIDGKNQIITSSLSHPALANDFNYFFPRIINTYENRCNTFTPNLDCSIKITYSPIRKIGI